MLRRTSSSSSVVTLLMLGAQPPRVSIHRPHQCEQRRFCVRQVFVKSSIAPKPKSASIGRSLPRAPPPVVNSSGTAAHRDGSFSDVSSNDDTTLSAKLLRNHRESAAMLARFSRTPTLSSSDLDRVDTTLLQGLAEDVVPLSGIVAARKVLKISGCQDEALSNNDAALRLYARFSKAESLGYVGIEWHPSVGSMCRLRGGGGAGAGVLSSAPTDDTNPSSNSTDDSHFGSPSRVVVKAFPPYKEQVEALKRLTQAHPEKAEFLWDFCFVWLRPHLGKIVNRFKIPDYRLKWEAHLAPYRVLQCDAFRLARTMLPKQFTQLQIIDQRCSGAGEPVTMPDGWGSKNVPVFVQLKGRFDGDKPQSRKISPLQVALQYPQYFDVRWENPTEIQQQQAVQANVDPPMIHQHCWLRFIVWKDRYCLHHTVSDEKLKEMKDEATQAYRQFREEQGNGEKFKHAEVRELVKLRSNLQRAFDVRRNPSVFQDLNVLAFYMYDLLPFAPDVQPTNKESLTAVMREDCLRGMDHQLLSKKELRAYHNLFRVSEYDPPKWGMKRRDLPLSKDDIKDTANTEEVSSADIRDMLLKATEHPRMRNSDPRNRGDIGTLMGFLPAATRRAIKTKWGGITAVCELHPTVFTRDPKDRTWRVRVLEGKTAGN